MAESSCDLAPVEFDYTALIDSAGGFTVAVERCPLCSESKRPFLCKDCVNKGNFIHSKATYPKRYIDKYQEWDRKKIERNHLLQRFQSSIVPVADSDNKKCEIEECRRKISLLKSALSAAKDRTAAKRKDWESLKKENYLKTAKGRKHKEKERKICEYIEKTKSSLDKKADLTYMKYEELKNERQANVEYLTRYIFSVEEVKPRSEAESMSLSDEVQEQLMEACHTAYVRGRWVFAETDADIQFRIVEPVLPIHGDYSLYNLWVASVKENEETKVTIQNHPAHGLSAGLCYTTQFLSVLAHILQITLPRRLCYSEFCSSELSEKHFNSSVARLNQNVLYLCFSQGVELEKLDPKHTLQNLVALLQSPTLGRVSYFDIDEDMMQSIEDQGSMSEDSEEELNRNFHDEVDFPADWESVPIELPEVSVPSGSHTVSSIQTTGYTSQNMSESTLSASNLVSSAAQSVASFWRAATGQLEHR